MTGMVELPYEFQRSWPEEWDVLPLLKQEESTSLPSSARYLHPAIEVRPVPGRGRGVVATQNVEAGELLLLDMPLVTAPAYEELVEKTVAQSKSDPELRRHLLSMCGDPEDEAARADASQPPRHMVVRNIIRHNYHGAERPPVDGEVIPHPVCGLWPLASLVNHSLRPNVARSFMGNALCFRLIRPLSAGEEVLDNYLDLRLPHSTRKNMLRQNHNMEDEGPDAHDAPSEAVAKVRDAYDDVMALNSGTLEDTQAAFTQLAGLTNQCCELNVVDPALSDIFRHFALLAGQLGDAEMCLEGYAQALEFAAAREPFNIFSCIITTRMLGLACLAAEAVDGETRAQLEAVAREHYRVVYGAWPGLFEALNPELMRQLTGLQDADMKP